MKLLLVGNSHVGAVNGAFIQDAPGGIKLDIYAIPDGCGPRINVNENGILEPCDASAGAITNLKDKLPNMHDYDAIVVSSAGIHAPRNNFPHPLKAGILADLSPTPDAVKSQRPVTQSLFEACVFSTLSAAGSIRLVKSLSTQYRGELLVQICPLPAESVCSDQHWYYWSLYSNLDAWKYFIELQLQYVSNLCKDTGAILLTHPVSGALQKLFNPEVYSSKDPFHMNQEYGALVREQILAQVLKDI